MAASLACGAKLDVETVLKQILLAIDRVKNRSAGSRHVALRGFSWIVEPVDEQVVIAIEIPMGAAVAGPFAIERARLDEMIRRVIAAAARARTDHSLTAQRSRLHGIGRGAPRSSRTTCVHRTVFSVTIALAGTRMRTDSRGNTPSRRHPVCHSVAAPGAELPALS